MRTIYVIRRIDRTLYKHIARTRGYKNDMMEYNAATTTIWATENKWEAVQDCRIHNHLESNSIYYIQNTSLY